MSQKLHAERYRMQALIAPSKKAILMKIMAAEDSETIIGRSI
jgi:hypothetical protein